MRTILFSATVLLFLLGLQSAIGKIDVRELPTYNTVVDFKLDSAEGREVSLQDLKGKVWVANFFFTSCPHVCPLLTSRVSEISQQFIDGEPIRFVSISVDPSNDSVEVIKQYSEKYQANPEKWFFLRGPNEEVKKLAVDSFNLATPDDLNFHSTRLVLIDESGVVRGFYSSNEEEARSNLVKDIRLLLSKKSL